MKIAFKQLRRRSIDGLIIESVDLSLYIAHALLEGRKHLITDADGKALKTRNLLDMKKALAPLKCPSITLTQRSSYDEMVGHGHRAVDNQMEVPLAPGYESLPSWEH